MYDSFFLVCVMLMAFLTRIFYPSLKGLLNRFVMCLVV